VLRGAARAHRGRPLTESGLRRIFRSAELARAPRGCLRVRERADVSFGVRPVVSLARGDHGMAAPVVARVRSLSR
jgi:hypothetical protein